MSQLKQGDGVMELKRALEKEKDTILASAVQHGAKVRVFGSVARGEATENSDLDLLVDMEEGRTLLDLIGLGQELSDLLRCKVDVMTEQDLSPMFRSRVLREATTL